MENSIIFPSLHITLKDVGKSISIGGFSIAYYGIIIAIGMLVGVYVILKEAKRLGYSEEQYLDLCIYTILASIVGARLYYVVFSWDYYKDNLLSIFNLRSGGLAIYGGILTGILTLYLLCRHKKIEFLAAADVCILGVVIGQIFGRWGNFFNREAFGEYTNSLFAMQLPIDSIRSQDDVTVDMLNHIVNRDGVNFISVHPTFFYESCWNFFLLMLLLIFRKDKKYDGQIFCMYMFGYGLGRFLIESLRTDQLKIWNTAIPVSQVVAITMMIAAVIITIVQLRKKKTENK